MVPRSHPLRPSRGQQWPPDRRVFVSDPSFQAPLLWQRLLVIGEGVKKGNPGMQLALLLLFDVAHTLFPPEGPIAAGVRVCRFASYSLKFIHILGDLGVGVKLAFLSMKAVQSIPQAFLKAAYRFLCPGPRSATVKLQRKASSLESRWKMRSLDRGEIKVKRSV